MTKQTVKIFKDLKNNKAIKVNLYRSNFHIDDNQAYTLQLTDNVDCGVYRAYANVYGQPRLLLDFTSFPTDKLTSLKKKLNKIGAIKVNGTNLMFYVVSSFNDYDVLSDVYTQARAALGLYKYVSTAEGIGIVRIDYGVEDYVIFRDVNKPENLHHVKINYNGDSYFNYRGRRFHLNDFIRTNL